MFVQVIQGKIGDADHLKRTAERWQKELQPGSVGYLGTTYGATDNGRFIAIARFDNETNARKNNDRPEQGAWWAEMSKGFDGDAEFKNSSDVDMDFNGGSDKAGFVQVIQGRPKNAKKFRELEKQFREMDPADESSLRNARPALIGGFTAWHDDGSFSKVVYFTSEAAARADEAKEMPAKHAKQFEEWLQMSGPTDYFDIRNPMFNSA